MPNPPLALVTPRHWMVVVGSGLLMSVNVLVFLSAGLLLPPLAETLNVGLSQVMIFISINMLVGALTMAIAGSFLLRRLGARMVALVGGSFTGLMLFAVAFVTNLPQLYLLAFASGTMATLSLQLTGAALINDWFMQRRGLMLGLLMGIASLGGIVAGAILPSVVTSGGWQLGFQVVGAVTVVVAVLAGGLLIRSKPGNVGLQVYGVHDSFDEAHQYDAGVSPRCAVRSPQFLALIIGLVLFAAIMALQQHLPSMMAERGHDLAAAGSLLSVLSVANVAATLLLGNLIDRFGPLVAYLIAGGLLLAAIGMFLLTTSYPAQVVTVLLFSIPAVTPPIMTPILLRHAFGGRSFVSLLGVTTATMPAGIAMGSPLWGLAKDATGSFDAALTIAAFLTIVIVALVSYALVTGPRLKACD